MFYTLAFLIFAFFILIQVLVSKRKILKYILPLISFLLVSFIVFQLYVYEIGTYERAGSLHLHINEIRIEMLNIFLNMNIPTIVFLLINIVRNRKKKTEIIKEDNYTKDKWEKELDKDINNIPKRNSLMIFLLLIIVTICIGLFLFYLGPILFWPILNAFAK